jgi:hypothetical protein
MKRQFKVLIRGVVIVAVLIILRLVLPGFLSPAAADVVKFMTVFLAILMTFIFFVAFLAAWLGGKIGHRIHNAIQSLLMLGIVLGVFGMFQPWTITLYRVGFHVLLVSLFSFILWSHIVPRTLAEEEAEAEAAAIAAEQGSVVSTDTT